MHERVASVGNPTEDAMHTVLALAASVLPTENRATFARDAYRGMLRFASGVGLIAHLAQILETLESLVLLAFVIALRDATRHAPPPRRNQPVERGRTARSSVRGRVRRCVARASSYHQRAWGR